MQRGHGDATKLIMEGVDLGKVTALIDEVVANGGVGERAMREDSVREDAVRMATVNDFLGPKRFGRMFTDLEPFRPPDESLRKLGGAMKETVSDDPASEDSEIVAGVTYLGQFIDHDITFDQTVGFPEIDDPEEIEQARTPTLDLDSLYGLGPRRQQGLYDSSTRPSRALFKVGLTNPTPDVNSSLPNDLPRRRDAKAIVGDPRNDENLVWKPTLPSRTPDDFKMADLLRFVNEINPIG